MFFGARIRGVHALRAATPISARIGPGWRILNEKPTTAFNFLLSDSESNAWSTSKCGRADETRRALGFCAHRMRGWKGVKVPIAQKCVPSSRSARRKWGALAEGYGKWLRKKRENAFWNTWIAREVDVTRKDYRLKNVIIGSGRTNGSCKKKNLTINEAIRDKSVVASNKPIGKNRIFNLYESANQTPNQETFSCTKPWMQRQQIYSIRMLGVLSPAPNKKWPRQSIDHEISNLRAFRSFFSRSAVSFLRSVERVRAYSSQCMSAPICFTCLHCQTTFSFLIFVCPKCHRIHPKGGEMRVATVSGKLDPIDTQTMNDVLEKSSFPAEFSTQLLKLVNSADSSPSLTPHYSYFSLFRCTEQFQICIAYLKEQHRTLQKIVHPDKFSSLSSSPGDKLTQIFPQVQFQSSCISKAYAILEDPLTRAAYILHLVFTQTDCAPLDKDLFDLIVAHPSFSESGQNYERELFIGALERNEELDCLTVASEVIAFRDRLNTEIDVCIQEITQKMNSKDWQSATKLTIWLRYLRKIADETYKKLENLKP